MRIILYLNFALIIGVNCFAWPSHWWKPVDESQRYSWEILPQDAKKGEVILSKRNELGILSNFAATEFEFDGKKYASIEGLWQSMKYPDPGHSTDPRHAWDYKFTRDQVAQMSGHEAKDAGSMANEVMKANNFKQVSYRGHFFNYKDFAAGSRKHYKIIYRATWQKIKSSAKARNILIQTKGLILKPDHRVSGKVPASYEYYNILMEIREKLTR